MRSLLIALTAVVLNLPVYAQAGRELWNLKLTGERGIQSFDRDGRGLWIKQQGVVFLSPERVLIYQVNRLKEPAPLSKRAASGGAGNFHLVARVLDARTGAEIKRLSFITTPEFSSILPTHDGKFIVRAGKVIGLYSATFELLASKDMPPGKESVDYWQVETTPSGRQVVAAHQQLRIDRDAPLDGSRSHAEADLEFLDADTFASLRKMHLAVYMPVWKPHEQFLLLTTPGKMLIDSGIWFGKMDFENHWKRLDFKWMDHKSHCVYNIDLLEDDLMTARGCTDLVVFPPSGEPLLSLTANAMRGFVSVAGAGHYLAIESEEYAAPVNRSPGTESSHIEVYDLTSRKKMMSAKLETKAVFYAVSKDGLLAVVDGDRLAVYAPAR